MSYRKKIKASPLWGFNLSTIYDIKKNRIFATKLNIPNNQTNKQNNMNNNHIGDDSPTPENTKTDSKTWFEGIVEYEYTIYLGGLPLSKKFSYKKYCKNGDIMIESYNTIGVTQILYNHEKQISYSKVPGKRIEKTNPLKTTHTNVEIISRRPINIKGHKCIKVVHSTEKNNTKTEYTHWVDESYAIPYAEGRISEAPKGLIVKGEVNVLSKEFNFSYKITLKDITKEIVPDYKFKL